MFQIIRWSEFPSYLTSKVKENWWLDIQLLQSTAATGKERFPADLAKSPCFKLLDIDISKIYLSSKSQKSTFSWTVDNVHWTSSTAAVRSDCKSLVALLQIFAKTYLFQIIGWSFISFCYIWALSWTADIQSQLLLLQFVCRTSQAGTGRNRLSLMQIWQNPSLPVGN